MLEMEQKEMRKDKSWERGLIFYLRGGVKVNLKLWDQSSGGPVGEEEDSDLQMASLTVSAHQQNIQMNRSSAFTIDSILGLNRPDQRTALSAPYRPWTDVKPGFQNLLVLTDRDASVDVRVNEDGKSNSKSPADTYRRTLNWYIGRRPRTAFSSVQIKILESVFQVNSYPGIDIREELAKKLHLDEDRIQIWFQNRRAKLKRSHRESQFLMVKNVLNDLQTSREEH
ncbi:homeobox expressed in ES cells 1 [Siphateles boraxobius]|uniref:homeobox expressed in ES cells 1 n=1 Tax=Siphateles boraxobius TaxID=180520 RepID=UPI004064BEE7